MLDHFLRGPAPAAGAAPAADPNLPLETHVTVGGLTLPHQGSFRVGTWSSRARSCSTCPGPRTPPSSRSAPTSWRARPIGQTDYWICYGPAGDSGEVTLKLKTPAAGPSQFDFTYPAADAVSEIKLDSGDGHHAVLLVMNTEMTNRTWLAHDKVYVGPSFVLEDGRMEFPPEGGKATVYAAAGKSEVTQAAATVIPDPPALANWSWRDAAPERAAGVNTAKWLSSTGPQPMETYDSFQNRYGWYRATLHADKAGPVYAALRRPIGNVRPVPERPARRHDHPELRPVRLAHVSQRSALATTPWPSLSRRPPDPRDVFRDLDRHADSAWIVGRRLRRFAASTAVDVRWKKWDKVAPRRRCRRAGQARL